MWQSETVERALFKWPKWRQSIISQWAAEPESHLNALQYQLQAIAAQELGRLGFPSCPSLENYWICCITSDYNLEYPTSFKNIVAPSWISTSQIHGYKIQGGFRGLPPCVLDEDAIQVERRCYPWLTQKQLFPNQMFLPQEHLFYTVLRQVKGRPPSTGKIGKHPVLSDRLAVRCAALKDSGRTYVEIARELDLPITRPNFTKQSDAARHLVQRGKRLIAEIR